MSTPRIRRPARHRRRAALLLAALPVAACGEARPTGRDWIRDRKAVEQRLGPAKDVAGVLYFDPRVHPDVGKNYGLCAAQVARVLKLSELFNQRPLAFKLHVMFDAADFAKYGPAGLDDLGGLGPDGRSIFLHLDGRPLVDRGQNRRLVQSLAHAVLREVYPDSAPAWLVHGLARYFADGAFDDEAFHPGLPDPDAWSDLLPGGTAPTFAAVRAASRAEFAAMGAAGLAVAHAAVHTLYSYDRDQFLKVVWQYQLRRPQSKQDVEALFNEFFPGFVRDFADPAGMLFKLRPDLREFLECGRAAAAPDTVPRCRKNAETYAQVGAYWFQLGKLLQQTGDAAGALEAFERGRTAKRHRWLRPCLDALIDAALATGDGKRLGELARQALQTSVQPTPRMYRALVESVRESAPEEARRYATHGLTLPQEGYAEDVARLRELAAAAGG